MYVRPHTGQYETYLFRRWEEEGGRGEEEGRGEGGRGEEGRGVMEAVRKCWASCYSQRVMLHRMECGLDPCRGSRMAVVIQVL